MNADLVIDRLFEALVAGDRPTSRAIIAEQTRAGADPATILTELFWPTYQLLDKLFRADKLTILSHNYATRLLRVLADQTAAELLSTSKAERNGRTVVAACGPSEASELGAQIAMDILESSGFTVRFAGGGVPIDEIQNAVQQDQPEALVMFCSEPGDLPDIRALIDTLYEVGACPDTQIVVGGGVFNRAEELAEEIGADLWATDPIELVDTMIHDGEHRAPADQRTVGRKRRIGRAA
ncbi:MAG: corrinoid methyltransferase [Phycisphaeraceae bacterium]|nr:MAG: corrinoid methyltransferase [Phycisphaeraceae bacterium]